MPTKTTSQKSRTTVLERDLGLEVLGLGIARPPRTPGRCRTDWSIRRSIELLAAGGSGKLSECRRIGGSVMR